MSKAAMGYRVLLAAAMRALSAFRLHDLTRKRGPARVLAIVPEGPDRMTIRRVSEAVGMPILFSEDPAVFSAAGDPIVIYDRSLALVDWASTIRLFTRRSPKPYVILLSAWVDTNLLDRFQSLGGTEILKSPIDAERLAGALRSALQLRQSMEHVYPQHGCVTK